MTIQFDSRSKLTGRGAAVFAGVVCIMAAIAIPTILYAYDVHDGKLWDWGAFADLSGATLVSFAIFAICRFFVRGRVKGFLLGCAGSNLGLLVLAYVFGSEEGRMWFPIALPFLIPLMMPLILLIGLGCGLVWGGLINRSPNP